MILLALASFTGVDDAVELFVHFRQREEGLETC